MPGVPVRRLGSVRSGPELGRGSAGRRQAGSGV